MMEKTFKKRDVMAHLSILAIMQSCSGWMPETTNFNRASGHLRVEGFKLAPTVETYSSCGEIQKDFYNQLLIKKESDLGRKAEWVGSNRADNTTSDAPSAEPSQMETGAGETFTNVQESGVDEGDLVKISEHHIITEVLGTLQIVDRATLNLIGTLNLDIGLEGAARRLQAMYVDKDKLITIQGNYSAYSYCGNGFGGSENEEVSVRFFKLSENKIPVELDSIEYTGTYNNSRLVNGHLILVINDTIGFKDEIRDNYWDLSSTAISEEPLKLKDDQTESGIDCSKIVKQAIPDLSNSLTSVHSIPVRNEAKEVKSVAALGTGDHLYMSQKSLLLAKQSYYWSPRLEDQASTPEELENLESASLLAVDFNQESGDIRVSASGIVRGRIKDQWSFKEFAGENAFAVMTTTGSGWSGDALENHLWILKSSGDTLDQIGSIQNFGSDEEIKSVRYVDRIAYAVTFRQIDPLFAFDLSDLENPVKLGELKIPGFSAYMHPLASGRLLGLGFDGDDSGRISGVQVSVFDTSDPKNLSRIASDVQGSRWSYSEAISDHHAFLYSQKYQTVAFPLMLEVDPVYDAATGYSSSGYKRGSALYSTEGDELVRVGNISHESLLPNGCGTFDPQYGSSSNVNLNIRRFYEVDDRLISISALGLMSHRFNQYVTPEKTVKFKVDEIRCYNSSVGRGME